MPVNKVGHLLKENSHRIWTIFNHWIGLTYQSDNTSSVTQLGFDETSRRKGHQYVTIAVDLEERRVIHVVEGKDAKTIEDIKDCFFFEIISPIEISFLRLLLEIRRIKDGRIQFPFLNMFCA